MTANYYMNTVLHYTELFSLQYMIWFTITTNSTSVLICP